VSISPKIISAVNVLFRFVLFCGKPTHFCAKDVFIRTRFLAKAKLPTILTDHREVIFYPYIFHWSSSLDENDNRNAWAFNIYVDTRRNQYICEMDKYERCGDLSVRPVK